MDTLFSRTSAEHVINIVWNLKVVSEFLEVTEGRFYGFLGCPAELKEVADPQVRVGGEHSSLCSLRFMSGTESF